jgi:LPS-assembly protein
LSRSLLRSAQLLSTLIGAFFSFQFDGALAQVPPPNRGELFIQDSQAERAARAAELRRARAPRVQAKEGLDFQAPVIEFDRDKNEVVGKGGVLVSEGGVQVQADEGRFNMQSRDGTVRGNVVVSGPGGVLAADEAALNVPKETGEFTNLEFEVEDGGFLVGAAQAKKVSEFDYDLSDSSLTSCRCPDGAKPWEVRSSSCAITQGAYAHTYGSSFYFEGIPVLYTPWLAFPVKNERASGLLAPRWGTSSQDGFLYRQPVFVNVNESTDLTISPFIATNSRLGVESEVAKVFSATSNVRGGLLYSDESKREGSLRGLNTTGISGLTKADGTEMSEQEKADKLIDLERFGGYYRQKWQSDRDQAVPLDFIADGRYTSDDFLVREIWSPNIGDQRDQFLTSTAVLRGSAFQSVNAELRSEYNQMLIANQDTQFQRVPEASLSTIQTFRPWGFNPYGLKLVSRGSATGTDFVRNDGYDGWRVDVRPSVAVPFHVASYVRGAASVELRQTQYSLRETMLPAAATPLPDGSTELEDSSSRTLPIFSYGMNTAVERVYEVERESFLSKLATLGARHERTELARLKHTFEPTVQYVRVPDVDQRYNPLFDQADRYRERSQFVYGFTSRLYGRFLEPYERTRSVEELTAAGETLPTYDLSSSILDFGRNLMLAPPASVDTRNGEVRELVTFSVKQAYDQILDKPSATPTPTSSSGTGATGQSTSSASGPGSSQQSTKAVKDPDAMSDVNIGLSFQPSSYFSFGGQTNVDPAGGDFSSYQLALGFRDDRDDALRVRYSFIDQNIDQVEGNGELKISQQLRAGYYARYDANQGEIMEQRAVARFMNACNCWGFDLGVSRRINPDDNRVLFNFILGGLGDMQQAAGATAGATGY